MIENVHDHVDIDTSYTKKYNTNLYRKSQKRTTKYIKQISLWLVEWRFFFVFLLSGIY